MKLFQKIKQLAVPYTIHLKSTPIVTLDTFQQKGDESKFEIITDQQIGGDSKGVVLFKDDAVTFFGEIQVDKKKQLETLPYTGILQQYIKSINIARFTKLLLTMRTDGQIYKVRLGINSSLDFGQHTAHAFIVDQSQAWNTYAIPFTKFEHQGFDKETTSLESSSEGLQLYTLEILRESKTNDKIAFQIKELAVSTEELTEQEINYPKPIFYKYLEKQTNIETGNAKYNPALSNNIKQKQEKGVNNFFE